MRKLVEVGIYSLFVLCAVVYMLFPFELPSSAATIFNLSPLIRLLILLPLKFMFVVIWLLGVYTTIRLIKYARSLDESNEEQATLKIAYGIGLIALGLILGGFSNGLRSLYLPNIRIEEVLTIVTNYVRIWIPLGGFVFIYQGTLLFNKITPSDSNKTTLFEKVIILGLVLLLLAILLFLIFTNPYRQVGVDENILASYFLSDPLIVITIVIPTIFTWILGFLSISAISHFQKTITDTIYRNFTKGLSKGIILVILASILLQIVNAVGGENFFGSGIFIILLTIVLFLILHAIGFGFIVYGVLHLKNRSIMSANESGNSSISIDSPVEIT